MSRYARKVRPSTNRSSIRVLFPHFPPHVSDECPKAFPPLEPSLRCPYPGSCVEILTYLADFIGVKIEPIVDHLPSGQIDSGAYRNGTWDGVLGYVANGTADTACILYQETDLRKEFFDFTTPVYDVSTYYAVHRKRSASLDAMWNVFNPYSFWTWMAILAMFIIQMMVCMFVMQTEVAMKIRKRMEPFEASWKLLRLQLLQPDFLYFHTRAGKFTVTIFAFVQCAILLALYQSWLLTAILRPDDRMPFKSKEALLYMVDIRKYSLVTHDSSNWFFSELSTLNVTYFRDLRKATHHNPVVRTRTLEEAVEITASDRLVMVTQEDTASYQSLKAQCHILFIEEGMPTKTAHFVFAKDSPWLALFNRAIGFNYEYLRRTYRKYFKNEYRYVKKKECSEKDDEPEALKPLRINAILGLFVVVCGGLILGGITLMLECVWKRCVKKGLYDVKKRMDQRVMGHKVSLLTFYLEQMDRMKKRQ